MKLPICWLKDYVDFEDTVEGLADRLTFSGVEVEGIERVGLSVEGLVVADILSVKQHPNADRLSLCKVFDGNEELDIVCGAPNVKAGRKGILARLGTVFPDGMKLKKTKIRGEVSMGMLCAEDEIGLSDDHGGIILLDADFPAGTPAEKVLGEPETVLDLEITPNRPDCLSIIGLAREVAALYGTTMHRPAVSLNETGESAASQTSVKVEDTEGCGRYTARIIKDVSVGPAPDWMQKRLRLAGIRPINNLVDITNFVLLECGHPLHAFDQSLLSEGRIVVRRAKTGETITALDESAHKLDAATLVIADAEKPVAIAGVMGGVGSEISETTSTVLLESAWFNPPLIRATSKALELRSDSSYRFERGTDIEQVDWASRRAAALMQELAGGSVLQGLVDVYPVKSVPQEIELSWDKLTGMMGCHVDRGQAIDLFNSLELEVESSNDDGLTVKVPSFRLDLERDVDLVEEYARMNGLDNIPTPAPRGLIVPAADDLPTQKKFACRDFLVGQGLHELVNYSLTAADQLDPFQLDTSEQRVVLPNPVSMDQSVLRTTLVPGVVHTLARNLARQVRAMACFEIGKVYFNNTEGEVPVEEERVCAGFLGPVGRDYLDQRRAVEPEEAFLWAKGTWENLCRAMAIEHPTLKPLSSNSFTPEFAVEVHGNGKRLGVLGILDRKLASSLRIADAVAVIELSLSGIMEHWGERKPLKPLVSYPSTSRDIALIAPPGVQHADILRTINNSAPKALEDVQIFDIFKGAGESTNQRVSMAYTLTYRSSEGTLTDEEANRLHEEVKTVLRRELGVEIRES